MALQLIRRRFTTKQYHKMARAGILGEDDRVELIDGEILEMSPINPRHSGTVARLTELLVKRFSEVALVFVQNPVELDNYNEPQPDFLLLRRRGDYYSTAHPGPTDVLLAIEVADSSLGFDTRVKGPLYARRGIPEYWLVDLRHGTVSVFREPGPEGYRSTRIARRGESLEPLAFPGLAVAVDEILG